ncbi:MAG: universal stress protein, partial [Verrucomicrobiales bacterium]
GCIKADRVIPGILEFTKSEGADLLVVGSHRPGRIERALLGSVSDGIVRQVKVPVLVIPPHDKI